MSAPRIRRHLRTVTINRTHGTQCSDPFEDITVVVEGDPSWTQEKWRVTEALDEDGKEVSLDKTEDLLARCLAASGVDETGR